MGNKEIYAALYGLRDKLRRDGKTDDGRIPNVCSDEALREMSEKMPSTPDELENIPGLDSDFSDKYGGEFLAVVLRFRSSDENGKGMAKKTADTLRELEKKLVNINKNNRMLYQGRTSRSLAFDLTNIATDFSDLLFGNKRSIRMCDSAADAEQMKMYKILTEMIREVSRNARDTGQYDLFIAYPFVQGKMSGEDLDIRAPLALFPVTLEKDSRFVTLTMDRDRDPLYNGTLVLAYIKAASQNRPMPDLTIESCNKESFLGNLLRFYSEQGITMEPSDSEPVPFREYRYGEFPKYLPGDLKMVPNIVLGRYSTCSSSIQLDFDRIIESNEINETLHDLIVDLEPGDFYEEGRAPLSEAEIKAKGIGASEKDLIYINPLNSAQENVLTGIQKKKELVIQGPPGTGKSQVITGLIISEVLQGRNVLMVSEKKTALDVVYSRLGTLSKYCLIVDDAGDKEEFYSQIRRMLATAPQYRSVDFSELSETVDRNVAILNGIADRMYSPDSFGLAPYRLYSMDRWLDLSDRHDLEEYKGLKSGIDPAIVGLTYPEIKKLHKTFSDPITLRGFSEYRECAARTPWIKTMRHNLSEYDLGETKAMLKTFMEEVESWKKKNAISRSMGRKKIEASASEILSRCFDDFGEDMVKNLVDDPLLFLSSLGDYEMFSERSTVYNRMSPNEKLYGRILMDLSDSMKYKPPQCNDQIYKFVLNERLQKFDAENKDLMQYIQDFDRIVSGIDGCIREKMEYSKATAGYHFQECLRNITESKRRGDITRIAESKRKWNINKFVERYSYELFKGVRVWLLTPDVVSEILPFRMGLFDLVIFDEASQMYVERGIPSIYRAKKVVIAGDHKQLRPSSLGSGRIEYDGMESDEDSAALEEESLLDLARARYDSILLNFHYRSKYEELIAFSNYAFYNGRLYVSPNIAEPEKPPIQMFKVDGIWDNTKNIAEARKIIELLRDFFIRRRNNETVGIITFNAAQRDLINDLLDDECAKDPTFGRIVNDELKRFDNGEDVGLFIKNIESVQGDERDVIMFSIGYAPNPEGRMMQRFGWLNNRGGENRLNVAISRAKRKIYIVTSIDPEDLKVEDTLNAGPKILRKYLQYARAISDGDRGMADSILHSFNDERWRETPIIEAESSIADRVYSSLIRKGYTVDRHVGIGGYQIDLAVKQNGNYILGIECDSHLYEMSQSTRERDYHRQKYLESNGWKMHRVWTPGMWKDSEREIGKIVKAIENRN